MTPAELAAFRRGAEKMREDKMMKNFKVEDDGLTITWTPPAIQIEDALLEYYPKCILRFDPDVRPETRELILSWLNESEMRFMIQNTGERNGRNVRKGLEPCCVNTQGN